MSIVNAPTAPANGSLAPAVAPPQKLVVHDSGPTAYLFDTARFEQCYRVAKAMAQASLIPDHLTLDRKKNELPFDMVVGNCFMIVNQAVRWGMDPFALPAETYVIGNKLSFQGKLIAAVINARAGLKVSLQVIYNNAKGDDMAAVVFGSREVIPKEAWALLKKFAKDEDGEVYTDLMSLGVMCIRISVGQAKTANEMWKKDPQQKLFYTGATKWARRHAPEIILGVLTDDDMERIHDVQELPAPVDTIAEVTARLNSGRTAETIANEIKASEPAGETKAPETTEPDPLDGVKELMSACTEQGDVSKLAEQIRKHHKLTPEQAQLLEEIAEAHKARIRGE